MHRKQSRIFTEAEAEGRLDGLWYGKATEMRLSSLGP